MNSPFHGLRFARLELENFRAGRMIKLAIIAVALIPLIYGGLFLLAFLDPYGSLSNVPAAVVNEDQGATIDGEDRNLGQELCDQLVKNNKESSEGQASGYDWNFVDQQTATTGLDDATYYMELIIPKDFSKNVASADSDDPTQADLQVYFNPSTNLIATTVGQSMVTKIKYELTTKIEKEYLDQIFVKISDAADQMKDAVDGAQQLSDGLDDARNGSQKITDNLETLADGADDVDSGVTTLGKKMTQLKAGIEAAQNTSDDLATLITGVGDALTAYGKTQDATYLTTATQLAAKVKATNSTIGGDLYTYVTGLTSALGEYQTTATKAATIEAQMASAKSKMEARKSDMESAYGPVTAAQTALTGAAGSKLQANLQSLGVAAATFQASPSIANGAGVATAAGSILASTDGGVPYLLGTLQQFSTTLSGYQSAADDYQSAADDYQTIANKYQAAATAEATAAAAASEAKGTITGYLMGVKNTSTFASSSTDTVASAVSKLVSAVTGSLSDGTSQIASGASELASGSSTLTLGLKDAVDGSDELADGLSDGQQEMADNVSNSSAKTKMMSTPVVANGENGTGVMITQVKNYGTGFAPYFIGLGMWVGALMVSFLIRALNSRILMSRSSSLAAVLASYVPMAVICIVQAMLLLLFIQFVLGMTIRYPLAFYLFGVLVAMCFAAIIQFFRASLGTVGLVVIVVLLMLQLCTAAGTFPIEAELPFFNWLNPWLPMTYVVGGFRMAMAGLSIDYFWPNVIALVIFTVIFGIFTLIVAYRKRRVTMTTLYPPIKTAS